ncbi:unnamed protein product, partial [Gongylonema pulchrum]|uniref:Fanconi-associated nuclease n=1 Tax=Gongylonema pulchrum TaxID=637853 RepID=A0A183DT34_9BILA
NVEAQVSCEQWAFTESKTEHGVWEAIVSSLKTCESELSPNVNVPKNIENAADDEGKFASPYYVTLFNKILKKVFCNGGQYSESRFWGERLLIIHEFLHLSAKAKQLLIRLFLRKRKWLPVDKLSYPDISQPLQPLFEELSRAGLVDSSHTSLHDVEEAINLLHAPSLKTVAKHFRLDVTKAKNELSRLLVQFASQKNVFGITMEKKLLHKVKQELGSCFRLRQEVITLFSALFTLYSPSDMNPALLFDQPSINLPSHFLFVMLQLGIDKIRFPAPHNPPLINIYTDLEKLFSYVRAKEMEVEIARWTQQGMWTDIIRSARTARDHFEHSFSTQRSFIESLPPYLRRFTDAHIYMRCITHGVGAFERVRNYEEAVAWLEYLLYGEQFKSIFCFHRGEWWDRLALNLHFHLKDKDRAMKAVVDGLEDQLVGDKDRLLLQEISVVLVNTCDFLVGNGFGMFLVVQEMELRSNVMSKYWLCFTISKIKDSKKVGFFPEALQASVCLVIHYTVSVSAGLHAEGTLWHTVFGLLFYNIIFDSDIENVWFSETQMNPADLNDRNFYAHRQDLFELRFKEIEESNIDDLLREMENIYNLHYGVTNSEISWECFTDFKQISVSNVLQTFHFKLHTCFG